MSSGSRARLARALVVFACFAPFAPRARAACAGPGAGVTYAAGSSPQAVAVGDFDRDGVPDLAVANLSGPSLGILRGLGGGAYAAPVGYASGTTGRAVAVCDLDGDGIPDVAVAVGNGVALWHGVGDGSFTGGGIVVAGSVVRGIACADFDGDGIPDLALASSNTNEVLVLRGLGANGVGNGTFAAPVAHAVGAAPARLLAADVNGDGITDLVVANNSGASISILPGGGAHGLGDGSFGAATTLAVAGSPWAVAALDWSGDGVTDLVVSVGSSTQLVLLRGTGGGAFVAAGTVTTPLAPRDLVIGDFDGDGIVDVAAACAAGNVVALARGTGTGFAACTSVAAGSGATGLAAADLDGDGAPDLVCANSGAGTVTRHASACPPSPEAHVTLLAPLGHESWWPGTVQQARWSRGGGVAVVDVDLSRDGGATWLPLARGLAADHVALQAVGVPDAHLRVRVRDALVPARASASTADFTLCGMLGTAIPSDAALAPTHLASADLDGDGVPDLVACDAHQVQVMRGDGTGRFVPTDLLATDSTLAVVLADVDSDGRVDLVRLSPAGAAWRQGDGHGHFGAEALVPMRGATCLVVADVDRDGSPDFVFAGSGPAGPFLALRPGSGGTTWITSLPAAPTALACGDLDGDGLPDLAVAGGSSVQAWFANGVGGRGDGTFRAGLARVLPVAAGALAIADADGDGIPDVIACLPETGDLVSMPAASLQDAASSGGTTDRVVAVAGPGAAAPAVADLDGDGRADLVLALAGQDAVAVMPGGALAGPVSRFAASAAAAALVVDDFDGDGNPDVVVAGSDARVRCLPALCPPVGSAALALAPASFADTSAALVGFPRRLAWTRGGAIAGVRVELSRDGGARWTDAVDGSTADSCTWIAAGPACPAARLRVRDAACGTRADAGRPFAIRLPFAHAADVAAPSGAALFATADLDGDGTPELVVADSAGLGVHRADGGVPWSAAEPGVRRVALADVDGDGRLDLVALGARSVSVRAGDGSGRFGDATVVPLEAGTVDGALADLDGDGRPDLVTLAGDGNANRIAVRRGVAPATPGDSPFGTPAYGTLASAPLALALADVNGDGILDAVVLRAGALATLLGRGAGGRGDGTLHLTNDRAFACIAARALCVRDLDGDGRPDVAVGDSAAGALRLSAGDGTGGFGAPVPLAVGVAPVALVACDLDRDGTPDLLVGGASGTLAALRGVPGVALGARFVPAASVPTGGALAGLALADVDGDGVADAITRDPAGALHLLAGASAPAGAPRLLDAPAGAVRVGDAVPLRWRLPAGVDGVDVELSRDGGAHWTALARALPGATWTWTVAGAPTGAARLRVRDARVAAACDTAGPMFVIASSTTAVTPAPERTLALSAPWPNPARDAVAFTLALPAATDVRLDACDIAGRHVRTLASGVLPAGTHPMAWDLTDDRGRPLGPGLYFVRLRAGDDERVRRVVRVR